MPSEVSLNKKLLGTPGGQSSRSPKNDSADVENPDSYKYEAPKRNYDEKKAYHDPAFQDYQYA